MPSRLTPTLIPALPHHPAAHRRTLRPTLAAALLAAWLPWGNAQAAGHTPSATEFLDWAQSELRGFLPERRDNILGEGLVYRGPYSTGHYLGVIGDTVYALGPVTHGQLLSLGTLESLTCTVKPASCAPSDALVLVQGFLSRVSAVYANGITSGAALQPLIDGCYLHNGRSRAEEIARIDTDASVRSNINRKRGSTRRNIEVQAERFAINPDGSQRREIDVRYELVYADGFVESVSETYLQGSSAGRKTATGATCSTPQDSPDLRLRGNRRIVGASVTALNLQLDRYRLADGAPQATAARLYRNEIRFNITDPAGVATYATISGPGIVGSAYKMISPRLLRSAPEFAGKVGHYVDWPDDDSFKACRNANDNNYADASSANCTANGASNNNWRAQGTDPAQVDAGFAGYGFVAGGQYTIQVYADDGWKTVNGQAGKTPIASYTATLNHLPASAVALAGGSAGQYGRVSLPQTPAELASLARARSAASLLLSEQQKARIGNTSPLPFTLGYYFGQGRTAASTSSNFYPASRYNPSLAPAIGSASVQLPIPAAPSAMTQTTYAEYAGIWDNLNGLSIRHLITFE